MAILIAAMMASAFIACGGGDDSLDIAPTPTTAAATAVPTLPPASPTTAPIVTPTQAAGGPQEYTVQAGDTLGAIAAQFGVTVDAIVQANNIADPNLIVPGDTLTIPAAQ